MALQAQHFTEAALRAAYRDATNQDIAAGLIGSARQAALGDALEPWAVRVDRAMARLRARQPWTAPQRQWLDRLAGLVKEMGVADPALLDEGLFAQNGGMKSDLQHGLRWYSRRCSLTSMNRFGKRPDGNHRTSGPVGGGRAAA